MSRVGSRACSPAPSPSSSSRASPNPWKVFPCPFTWKSLTREVLIFGIWYATCLISAIFIHIFEPPMWPKFWKRLFPAMIFVSHIYIWIKRRPNLFSINMFTCWDNVIIAWMSDITITVMSLIGYILIHHDDLSITLAAVILFGLALLFLIFSGQEFLRSKFGEKPGIALSLALLVFYCDACLIHVL